MERSETIIELSKATSKMQGLMRSVPKDSSNPFFKMRYASLDAIWDTIRWPMTSNGLSLIQTTYEQNDKIYLETLLLHTSGEWIKTILPINATKQDPQSIGSAITYARRYSLSALLGVSSDEDDDAEATTNHKEATKPKPALKQETVDQTEHYCQEHKSKFFKTEKMKSFAHPIGLTGQWCYEHKDKPKDTPSTPEAPPAAPKEGQKVEKYPADWLPKSVGDLYQFALDEKGLARDMVIEETKGLGLKESFEKIKQAKKFTSETK